MADLSDQELVGLINDALREILAGTAKSYRVGSREVTKFDIPELIKQRNLLIDNINRESAGGVFRVIQIERPT